MDVTTPTPAQSGKRKPYRKPTLTRVGTLESVTQSVAGGSQRDRFARRGGVFKFPFRRQGVPAMHGMTSPPWLECLAGTPVHGVSLGAENPAVARAFWQVHLLEDPPRTHGPAAWIWYDRGRPSFTLWRTQNALALEIGYPGSSWLTYDRGSLGIYVHQQAQSPVPSILSMGLAIGLELLDVPCLHADGLVINQNLAGFLGESQAGKSTLAARLLTRGHQLLSDDMLALWPIADGFECHPSRPVIRLWPDGMAETADWPPTYVARIHPDSSKHAVGVPAEKSVPAGRRHPLRQLFLVCSAPDHAPVAVERVSGTAALLALLAHSLLGGAARPLGLEARRLGILGDVLCTIPLYRLSYPGGTTSLDEACGVVEAMMARLMPRATARPVPATERR